MFFKTIHQKYTIEAAGTYRAEMIVPEKADNLAIVQKWWQKFYNEVKKNASADGYAIAGAGRKNGKVNLVVTFFKSKAEIPQKVALATGFGSLPSDIEKTYKKQLEYLKENREEIDQAQKESQTQGYSGRIESALLEDTPQIVFKCKDHGKPSELLAAIQAFAKVILSSDKTKSYVIPAMRPKNGAVYMLLSMEKETTEET